MQEQRPNRRQEQAQESRQKLMDAALELFARRGYAETSVHALCASLGVADSLLYHYFPGGKKELIQAIVLENLMEVMGELNSLNAMVSDLPLEEMIESLYQVIRRAVLGHGDLFRLLLHQKEIRDLIAYEQFFQSVSARQHWFLQLLKSRAEMGEIQPMDFEAAAETLDSLMIYHLGTELLGLPGSPIGREANRKRLIAHQVGLWKRKTDFEA
ncbi:MAG: TetR/AcrR family transcriptional regulator [Clostridia bacterium]|nr:TetR/AcrR family transcriptional regulator [Clostridia bacterium]